MWQHVLSILAFAALPVAVAIVGAVVAAVRPPSPGVRCYIQHFAAGVVFSVVAVEILPEIVRVHRPLQVALGFALGTVFMLALRSLVRRLEPAGEEAARSPVGLLAGVGVDLLMDGFLIGIGFAAGAKEGRLLVVALAAELLSLSLSVASTLGKAGVSRGRAIATTSGLASLVLVGALASALLLGSVGDGVLEVVLSFGLAALLYLVTEELLVEAHEEPETPLATATFFAGFLLFLILGMA